MAVNGEARLYRDDFDPCNLPRAELERYAARTAEVFGFEPGGPLEDLVTAAGGRLHYEDSLETLDHGTLFVQGRRDFDIHLPWFTSPLRDRFTIAHELGHYFLHSRQGEIPIRANRRGSEPTEWEANWFAAALLMPAEEFRSAWGKRGGKVGVVALDFLVSRDAAAVRAKTLGLM